MKKYHRTSSDSRDEMVRLVQYAVDEEFDENKQIWKTFSVDVMTYDNRFIPADD